MDKKDVCCTALFSEFTFQDIRVATPPDRKGVYVIRVRREGEPIEDILLEVGRVIERLAWPAVGEKMLDRVGRLRRVGECPVVYIGSAGAQRGSRNTLRGRYKEFGGRHTAMFPLWVLVYFGWDLEYGWLEEEEPARVEAELKERYREIHGGRLPALVNR